MYDFPKRWSSEIWKNSNIVGVLGPSSGEIGSMRNQGEEGFATKQQTIVKLYTILYLLDSRLYNPVIS